MICLVGGISSDTLNRIEGYEITKITDVVILLNLKTMRSSTKLSGGGTIKYKISYW